MYISVTRLSIKSVGMRLSIEDIAMNSLSSLVFAFVFSAQVNALLFVSPPGA